MSIDVTKQISYWRDGSLEDMEVAGELLEKRRYRHGLFFAHLALEKALKAHVAKDTQMIPPKIHNLIRLSEQTSLAISPLQKELLREFDQYQIEGRYPGSAQTLLDIPAALKDFEKAKETHQWLINQL
ncbi:MAG: HEPN domain-containing protein [Candidatus Sumerlaeota bacterium]|nr:HEPN domain-containing protein [Candidatus Sumerlaeota bacterium]